MNVKTFIDRPRHHRHRYPDKHRVHIHHSQFALRESAHSVCHTPCGAVRSPRQLPFVGSLRHREQHIYANRTRDAHRHDVEDSHPAHRSGYRTPPQARSIHSVGIALRRPSAFPPYRDDRHGDDIRHASASIFVGSRSKRQHSHWRKRTGRYGYRHIGTAIFRAHAVLPIREVGRKVAWQESTDTITTAKPPFLK